MVRKILVVGGTRGIGLSTARLACARGWDVALTGRTDQSVAQALEVLERGHLQATGFVLDIGEPDTFGSFVERLYQTFGIPAGIVISAGVNPYFSAAVNISVDQWESLMAVNLRGPFFLSTALVRRMPPETTASIVMTSSVTATTGAARGLPYTASKGGIEAMVRTLAAEWAPWVRVNSVAPGFVKTDMTESFISHVTLGAKVLADIPLARVAEPNEIAAINVFLCGEESSYITGQNIIVDGGYSLKAGAARNTGSTPRTWVGAS